MAVDPEVTVVMIVRRFGYYGGMESYVWELSHNLLDLQVSVVVVCEEYRAGYDRRIRVQAVERIAESRRWKQMLRFREEAERMVSLLKASSDKSLVIHSHERSMSHHITTLHGPSFLNNLPLLSRFGRRYNSWRAMEYAELLGDQCRQVVPVSSMLGDQFLRFYPELANKLSSPISPGNRFAVGAPFKRINEARVRFLFVGVEWRRKGYVKALKVCEQFSKWYPGRHSLHVYGPKPTEICRYSFSSIDVCLLGWVDEIPYQNYDVMILPSRSEPYGMVVAEALARGCRVLCSDQVGALEKGFLGVVGISLDSSLQQWVSALRELIVIDIPKANRFSTWKDIARNYKDKYTQILEGVG